MSVKNLSVSKYILINLSLCLKQEKKDMFPVVKAWIKQEKARKKW